MKRIFDFVASGLGLIVLGPLFLILAVWIKLDSRGPVFYRQVRVGRNNKDFRIPIICIFNFHNNFRPYVTIVSPNVKNVNFKTKS